MVPLATVHTAAIRAKNIDCPVASSDTSVVARKAAGRE